MKKLNYVALLVLTTVFFVSCSNEEIEESVTSEELSTQALAEDVQVQSDIENFESVTYNGKTYSMEEVYANKEILKHYINAQVTFVDGENSTSKLYIFDSDSEFEKFNKNRNKYMSKAKLLAGAGITFYQDKYLKGPNIKYSVKFYNKAGYKFNRNLPKHWKEKVSSYSYSMRNYVNETNYISFRPHRLSFQLTPVYIKNLFRDVKGYSNNSVPTLGTLDNKIRSFQIWHVPRA
ncbi:hypothetical protein NBT05_03380 [Aquimarina sp. ERC-38]|uniref:hypothetical protein n=1 Tax=Aquimarina sp. ERC-38 TaxID=2949996 RepID=UPI0022483169|nr:hypothetical protein [Aquimarina sp. ERC-38]UZO81523.1 hypothetical protein NBT05_03380 [Aquimarina sp. ERC-38]